MEGRIDKRFIRTNDRIRAREIRVIGDEGEQIGVMPPFEALRLARSKNLDLVEISPTAQPPGLPHHGLREIFVPAGKERARGQEAPENDHGKRGQVPH